MHVPKENETKSAGMVDTLSPQPWAQMSQNVKFYQDSVTKPTTPLTTVRRIRTLTGGCAGINQPQKSKLSRLKVMIQ